MKDIKHLSKEEKMRLLCGKDGWSTVDFDGKNSANQSVGRAGRVAENDPRRKRKQC